MPHTRSASPAVDTPLSCNTADLARLLDMKLAPLISTNDTLSSKVNEFVSGEVMQEAMTPETSQPCAENKALQERLLYMGTQYRRENLRFFGFPEVQSETWQDCELKDLDAINKVGVDTKKISIAKTHNCQISFL